MIDKKRRRLLVLFNVPRTSLSAGDWRQYVCHSERLVVVVDVVVDAVQDRKHGYLMHTGRGGGGGGS